MVGGADIDKSISEKLKMVVQRDSAGGADQ
jgi:hypothetical protein